MEHDEFTVCERIRLSSWFRLFAEVREWLAVPGTDVAETGLKYRMPVDMVIAIRDHTQQELYNAAKILSKDDCLIADERPPYSMSVRNRIIECIEHNRMERLTLDQVIESLSFSIADVS